MIETINSRKMAITAGISYIVIFFAAIFANFFVLDLIQKSPLDAIQQNNMTVRFGIMAFIITVVFDVVVAWALYELYKQDSLSGLSTLFRMMHAAIMGVAIFQLPTALASTTSQEILKQLDYFNTIWLIGLFFFGIHLILLAKIIVEPKIIAFSLLIAGIMYMVDTCAHFLLPDYEAYSSIFLTLVIIPSIFGEMSFSIWLLIKGGKTEN